MKAVPDDSALFVYGSLLDADFRERLLGHGVETIIARLPDYRRRRGRYFYIAKSKGAETAGLLLLGLDTRDFAVLDRYEEVPRLYTRQRAEVIDARSRRIRCWLYLPTPHLLSLSRNRRDEAL